MSDCKLSRGNTPDRSIVAVMPLYNGARWVEESIRSVLAQTLPPNEFIVVDDGSTDKGPEIVERLAAGHPLIRLMRKANGGQSAARNFAVRQSTSAFIALIDQDDRWFPNHLADLMWAVRDHKGPPLGWVYSDFDDVDEHGKLVRRGFVNHVTNPKRDLIRVLAEGMIIQPSATLISRAAIEAVAGFDEQLCGYEDDDLFLRIFRAGYDNLFVPHATSQWRIHASSCGASDRTDASLKYYIRKLLYTFADDPWRGHFYARDVIAPRFASIWLALWIRAARYNNHAKMIEYASEGLALTKYLTCRRRLIFANAFRLFLGASRLRLNLINTPIWGIGVRVARVTLENSCQRPQFTAERAVNGRRNARPISSLRPISGVRWRCPRGDRRRSLGQSGKGPGSGTSGVTKVA
jgi:glycosyltransferase involved in cell wall biosynthesis